MTPEQLRERLTQVNGDRMALAEDLFGVADFLRTHSSVQRALTDPARSQTDKDSLIDRLFGPVVGEVSLQCLHDLGQGHWSRPRDIVLKIEDAGCDAVLLNAQLDGVLEETEAQLVAIAVFLQSHRDLRNELSDLSALSPKGRADLAQSVFQSVLGQPSMRLLRRCVGRTSHGHLLGKLRELAVRAANLSGRRFVFVESAHELVTTRRCVSRRFLRPSWPAPFRQPTRCAPSCSAASSSEWGLSELMRRWPHELAL